MQGPFSYSDILAWFDEGFYDDKLRIRPENGSFRELSVMLKAWGHVHKKRDISEMVKPLKLHQHKSARLSAHISFQDPATSPVVHINKSLLGFAL